MKIIFGNLSFIYNNLNKGQKIFYVIIEGEKLFLNNSQILPTLSVTELIGFHYNVVDKISIERVD